VGIRDELASFNDMFATALAENDPDRIADFYTVDAVFLSQGVPTVSGRAQILEMFRGFKANGEAIAFETGDVIEDGDLVIDIGSLLAGGKPSGRYVVVYRRQGDGSLKLAVDVPIRGS
jgi:ketosteroid isomerase-like protein